MTQLDRLAKVQAEVSRDDLRSLFHFFVGKPDSTIKIFEGPFEVSTSAIKDLHSRIIQKLKTHQTQVVDTSAYISFSDKTIKEFSSLVAFCGHQWGGAERTQEVTVKWDFLVDFAGSVAPQRHTLTVRIGRGLHPRQALQYLFNSDTLEDPHDLSMTPMYCRVDFVNPIIGKE